MTFNQELAPSLVKFSHTQGYMDMHYLQALNKFSFRHLPVLPCPPFQSRHTFLPILPLLFRFQFTKKKIEAFSQIVVVYTSLLAHFQLRHFG